MRENIKNFLALSVRDNRTQNVISEITQQEIELVCDPTLLVDRSVYDLIMSSKPNGRYLLLYIFEDTMLKQSFVEQIIRYATEHRLQIVSFGTNRKWCHCSVPYSPEKFVSYFKYAECVMTNTFHGTMFSIIYNKNFVALGEGKNKVIEAMNQYGVESRMIDQNVSLEERFATTIDFALVNKKLQCERQKGLNYIDRCLKKVTYGNS